MKNKKYGILRMISGVLLMFLVFCRVDIFSAAKEISECSVSLSKDVFTYSGMKFSPDVTVKDGEQILSEGTDYTLYGAEAYTVGEHEIIVMGQGNYSGRTSVSFEIQKAENEISMYQKFRSYSEENEYNLFCTAKGNAKLTFSTTTKGVSVTSDGKLHAQEGFLGTAKIKVTAEETELYQKTTKTFPVTLSLYGTSITKITLPEWLPETDHAAKVCWVTSGMNDMASLGGFRIRYSDDPSFQKNVRCVKVPMMSFMGKVVDGCIIQTGLVKGTKFYFQIGTYKKALNNKTYYSEWSETVSHKVDSSEKAFYKGKKPKNGEIYTVDGIKYQYKNKKFTAIGCSFLEDRKIVIADKIFAYGVYYPVTAIKAGAFKKVPGLVEKVTIGKNVTSIGKSAFADQNFIDTICIKSSKLKAGSIGKSAFRNVGYYSTTFFGRKYSQTYTVKIQVPKNKKASYKKLLQKSGIKGKLIWK